MIQFTWKQALASSLLAGIVGAVTSAPAAAQVAPPDFSSHQAGWVGLNGGGPFFERVPGVTPGPVTTDPAHPLCPTASASNQPFVLPISPTEPYALGQGAHEEGE